MCIIVIQKKTYEACNLICCIKQFEKKIAKRNILFCMLLVKINNLNVINRVVSCHIVNYWNTNKNNHISKSRNEKSKFTFYILTHSVAKSNRFLEDYPLFSSQQKHRIKALIVTYFCRIRLNIWAGRLIVQWKEYHSSSFKCVLFMQIFLLLKFQLYFLTS